MYISTVIAGMVLAAGSARAATINVTAGVTAPADDGSCSLREAITAANTDAAVDACPAGESGVEDVIEIPAGIYTFTVVGTGEDGNATGDLDITGEVALSGAGNADTIIDAAGLDRVIHILNDSDVVSMSGLTVRGGKLIGGGVEGCGIFSEGTLTLTRVVVEDNACTATSFAAGGGGIFIRGSLTVVESVIRDNEANVSATTIPVFAEGGGLLINAYAPDVDVTILGSTIAGNRVTAISDRNPEASGAGIYEFGAHTVFVRNSTITGNIATATRTDTTRGGGIKVSDAAWTIEATTITNNIADQGAGIYVLADSTRVRSTIIAGNVGPDVTGTPIDDQGFNLIGGNPALLLLADNGGPTPTHALASGSPAVDAGSCTDISGGTITVDQRGLPRPGVCDVGAFELGGDETLIVVSPEPPGQNCADGGQRIDSGVDFDGDGTLDPAEIEATAYICASEGGQDGQSGTDSLITTTSVSANDMCPAGGVRIDAGTDADENGTLDAEEIEATSYLCNDPPASDDGGCSAAGQSGAPAGLIVLALAFFLSLPRRRSHRRAL